jgi:hypothetical protein
MAARLGIRRPPAKWRDKKGLNPTVHLAESRTYSSGLRLQVIIASGLSRKTSEVAGPDILLPPLIIITLWLTGTEALRLEIGTRDKPEPNATLTQWRFAAALSCIKS